MHMASKHFAPILAVILALVCSFLLPAASPAADAYPTQAVKVIVAFTPGGTTDMLTRMVSTRLSEKLGQTFVVENKPGAGGNIGTEFVVRAAPDGYTLMVNSVGPIAVNPTLYQNLPHNPITDLEPVVQLADVPNVLVVPPAANTPDLKTLIAKGKTKQGGLSYGSTGIGTSSHLSSFMFAQTEKVAAVHIPYKGADALNDLLAGRVDFMFATIPSVMAHINSGKLVPIAVSSAKRSRSLPNIPTMIENGYPGFEAGSWFGFFAPRGTPRSIIDKLNGAVNEILKDPEIDKQMVFAGADPVGGSPEQFKQFIASEHKKWAVVVKDSGATAK
ncbi:MAG: tripartite tricarboxylate transporter substrate binding protein [Desulfobacterales bacterium]|jgi:tripartite-type tricarboxylate transporter receptor subunit TctC|nr:tripartite tricarboxylate transporter substrate binding protein [Desulfobacterales bacterium]